MISLLAPFLGTIADYKGKKKKFFYGFLFTGIFGTLLLSTVGKGNWIWCILIYVLSIIGYTGSNIFYDSFLTDVTSKERMDTISSTGFAVGYIGSCIPFVISIFLISKPSIIYTDTVGASKIAFILTALWWFVFSIPMLKNVKQLYYIEPDPNPVKTSFKRLLSTFKHMVTYKNILFFLIAYFFYIDGVNTIIKMATSYGLDLGIKAGTLMIILLVLQLVAVPSTIAYGKLAKNFSARKMIFVAIIIYSLISVYAYFVSSTLGYWILAILVGTSQGGIQALSRSYFGKLIPKENSSEFFGIYNIFGRFSSIFGPLLMGLTSQLTGNSKLGILSLVLLFAIGLFFFSKINNEDQTINSEYSL